MCCSGSLTTMWCGMCILLFLLLLLLLLVMIILMVGILTEPSLRALSIHIPLSLHPLLPLSLSYYITMILHPTRTGTSLFVGELMILLLRVCLPVHLICSVLQSVNLSKIIMGQDTQMSLFMMLLPGKHSLYLYLPLLSLSY